MPSKDSLTKLAELQGRLSLVEETNRAARLAEMSVEEMAVRVAELLQDAGEREGKDSLIERMKTVREALTSGDPAERKELAEAFLARMRDLSAQWRRPQP